MSVSEVILECERESVCVGAVLFMCVCMCVCGGVKYSCVFSMNSLERKCARGKREVCMSHYK